MSITINGTSGLVFSDATTQATAPKVGMVNRIINGAMVIDQRNAGAAVTASGQYTLDRWVNYVSGSGAFTIQQSSTAPSGFSKSMLFTVTTADSSLAAGDNYVFRQKIEGFNCADLTWGTASASAVTLSFWVRSSVTGTFGGAVANSVTDRSYPFTYTISSANTWEQKTITISGDTSGTWTTDNSSSIQLRFSLGSGSDAAFTANSWNSSNGWSATGATNLLATSGATFYITGVQLEKGSTATSFDYRPYGTELALCQRYCLRYCGTTVYEDINCTMNGYNSTSAYGAIFTTVPMRTSPSVSSSTIKITDQTNNVTLTSIAASGSSYSGPYNINVAFNASSGIVQYRTYQANANNSTSAFVILSAEL